VIAGRRTSPIGPRRPGRRLSTHFAPREHRSARPFLTSHKQCGDCTDTQSPHSHLTMSNSPEQRTANGADLAAHRPLSAPTHTLSFSRRNCARAFSSCHPDEGVAERRQAPGACEAPVGPPRHTNIEACVTRRAGALARRPASLEAGGTRASRRSTVAIFGLGSAFPAPPFPAEHVQPAPGSTGRGARRAVSEPPEDAVTSRTRGTPLPAPPSGSSPETPLDEPGCA
jgi:hypothetical protein